MPRLTILRVDINVTSLRGGCAVRHKERQGNVAPAAAAFLRLVGNRHSRKPEVQKVLLAVGGSCLMAVGRNMGKGRGSRWRGEEGWRSLG